MYAIFFPLFLSWKDTHRLDPQSPTHTTLPSQGQAARDAALETWQLVALKFPRKAGDQVYKFKRRAALTLESKVTTMVTHTKKKPSHNRSIEYYYITE